MESHSERLT